MSPDGTVCRCDARSFALGSCFAEAGATNTAPTGMMKRNFLMVTRRAALRPRDFPLSRAPLRYEADNATRLVPLSPMQRSARRANHRQQHRNLNLGVIRLAQPRSDTPSERAVPGTANDMARCGQSCIGTRSKTTGAEVAARRYGADQGRTRHSTGVVNPTRIPRSASERIAEFESNVDRGRSTLILLNVIEALDHVGLACSIGWRGNCAEGSTGSVRQ